MGDRLLDSTTPELGGEPFTHTLIWGSYDIDDDGLGESVFIEPMVTGEFMATLTRKVNGPVALPADVPWARGITRRSIPFVTPNTRDISSPSRTSRGATPELASRPWFFHSSHSTGENDANDYP